MNFLEKYSQILVDFVYSSKLVTEIRFAPKSKIGKLLYSLVWLFVFIIFYYRVFFTDTPFGFGARLTAYVVAFLVAVSILKFFIGKKNSKADPE